MPRRITRRSTKSRKAHLKPKLLTLLEQAFDTAHELGAPPSVQKHIVAAHKAAKRYGR